MPNQVKDIVFFANGHTAVIDQNRDHITNLQYSWMLNFLKNIPKEYILDLTKVNIHLPNGKNAKVFKTETGYNWNIQ